MGFELVIEGHINLNGNDQFICVGGVGLLSAVTCLQIEPTKGLNVPRLVSYNL